MNVPTIQFAEVIHGDGVALDDPAEAVHEASRLYPSTAAARLPGLGLIAGDPVVHASVERSSRRHPHRPTLALPPRRLGRARLEEALVRRRSAAAGALHPLALGTLATILGAANQAVQRPDGRRRPVPSAGALYPLELYAICEHVPGAPPGLLHHDPFEHRLELVRESARVADLRGVLADPTPLEHAAAVLVVTAVVWRSRFKYGIRGYRFALLEAGHLAQNLLLACSALRVAALPLGGFYDRRVDAVVGADGLDEVSLYVIPIGGEGTG